jgi:creatinine amidohydrolase
MLKFWMEMAASDFASLADRTVAILPVGATEQHGAHLPTGTDAMILDGVLAAAAKAGGPTRAVVLPTQAIGWSSEHGDLPGMLSLEPEMLAAGWVALGQQVARAGLSRLLILNGHGGNPPAISLAAMRLRCESGLLVVETHWEALAKAQALRPKAAPAQDWHAGWIETSVMLHLKPELARMERAQAGKIRHPAGLPPSGPARWAWMTTDLSPSGVIGDPRLATPALGARLVARAVEGLGALVDRIAAANWPPGGPAAKLKLPGVIPPRPAGRGKRARARVQTRRAPRKGGGGPSSG